MPSSSRSKTRPAPRKQPPPPEQVLATIDLEWRRRHPFLPQRPTPPQRRFLDLECREALYGGAAGGGKSSALLLAALQYVDRPGYAALLLRRTFADLALPDALMARAQEWLAGTPAVWNERDHRFTFPSGATLSFGYMETDRDRFRYQGSAFQFVGFDELTQFNEVQYRYLASRLRRLEGSDIPLRMRAASNPGGVGHEWVRRRFIDEPSPERVFVPARLDDNPHLDRGSYEESLDLLDPVTHAQLRRGDWDVLPQGPFFDRSWFAVVDAAPATGRVVRFWDLAATVPQAGSDPDWTVGAKLLEQGGRYWLLDIRRVRARPLDVERLIRQTAELDGRGVEIWMEQEGGSSGVAAIDHYAREVLKGFAFRGVRSTGSKTERARPLSSAAQAGNVFLVRGTWASDFLDEAHAFPGGPHDDQVDAVSGAFLQVQQRAPSLKGLPAPSATRRM